MMLSKPKGKCRECGRGESNDLLSESASNDLLCAEDIVKALADWSRKYPKGSIYPVNRKSTMDKELQDIEKAAKRIT